MMNYPMAVAFVSDQFGWLAVSPDLPGLQAYGSTPQLAIAGLQSMTKAYLAGETGVQDNLAPVAPQPTDFKAFIEKVLARG